MPGQGEQHKPAATSVNPFEEVKPHISEYTAQEIATLSSRLEKQLGPEYISSRPGAGGGKVHYLSADKCINLANEVFGFNGWSSGIQNVQIDFVDESQSTGKITLGLSVVVRVTLRDGTFHEDIGYGHIENCKGKAAAFEKAKKEGTTDGLKRALRNFGNLLGNCVYDKDYVAKVTKLKIAPTRWDPDNLYRHSDYAPVRKEPQADGLGPQPGLPQMKREWPAEAEIPHIASFVGNGEDEFGSDDFDETDFSVPQGEHPDEIALDPSVSSELYRRRNSLPDKQHPAAGRQTDPDGMQRLRSPMARNHSVGQFQAPQTPVSGAAENPPRIPSDPLLKPALLPVPHPPPNPPATIGQHLPPPRLPQNVQRPSNSHIPEAPSIGSSNPTDHEPPVGFFTARAAESLQTGSGILVKAAAFDPHLESPSIRKTAGVDHSKTKPIGRETVGAVQSPVVSRANFVNPQMDKNRRLGMPAGAASPLQNRGSYKPPQMKRPAEGNAMRPALEDVTAASVNAAHEDGGDIKRQKVGLEVQKDIGDKVC